MGVCVLMESVRGGYECMCLDGECEGRVWVYVLLLQELFLSELVQ